MSDHGTPLTSGDQAFISARLVTAAPGALKGLDPARVIEAIKSGLPLEEILNKALREAMNGNPVVANDLGGRIVSSHTVPVDRKRTVEKMVELGKYDWKDGDINQKHFPHDCKAGRTDTEIHLVGFPQGMESYDAVAGMDAMGIRPADNAELLSLGIAFPDLQREAPIVQLGSSWVDPGGDRYVSILRGGGGGRHLRLLVWRGRWGSRCRFAGVRK